MFELITVVIFCWLMFKGIGLAFRLTWGIAKIVASFLMILALPLLVVCLLFAGSLALIVPLVVIGIAVAIMDACV